MEDHKENEETLKSPGAPPGTAEKEKTGKSTGNQTQSLFNVEKLDTKRYQLEEEKQKNAKILRELEQKLHYAKQLRQRRLERMASYTADFISPSGGKTQEPSKEDLGVTSSSYRPLYEVKPRTLGRREAVLGTKRLVERQLKQVEKKQAVMEKKLNEAQNTNQKMREKIDGLRKEHLVYDKLFGKLEKEVEAAKNKITSIKKKIQEGYAERNRIRKEMQELTDRLQELDLEAKLEWKFQDKELAQADAIIRNPQAFKEQFSKDDGSQETEEFLKNQQQECLMNINRDRKAIDKLSDTWKTFEEALETIKDGTGYESIDELIQQFEAYEDEKYSKVNAINRLMADIESTETRIQSLKESHTKNEETNHNVIEMKQSERDELAEEIAGYRQKLRDQEASTKIVLREIGMLLPSIRDLFQSIGCGQLFQEVTEDAIGRSQEVGIDDGEQYAATRNSASPAEHKQGNEGKLTCYRPQPKCNQSIYLHSFVATEDYNAGPSQRDSPSSEASNASRSRSASSGLGMYLQSPSLRDTVARGISTHNIAEFVSILEQKAAELIHKYAVVMATSNNEEARHALDDLSRSLNTASPLRSSSLEDDEGEVQQTQESLAQVFGKTLSSTKTALVPERPTGTMHETFAVSTLLSSMIGTEQTKEDEDSDQEEYYRPLTLSEMKAKAAHVLNNSNFTVAKQASQAAASYLVKHQEKRRETSAMSTTSDA
eukprot:gb/GECG01008960.1/.p1 GENE.gb/GECG01008960.1/~~gb/GECG01008960.1/.p1  ORF type:complete len:715 (+),score=143.29 gb/GECG01008960.1/:1-2145(+)